MAGVVEMSSTQALGGVLRPSSPLHRVVQEGGADDLSRRAANGDRRAFAVLMASNKDGLYRFVRRRTPDAEEAYDIGYLTEMAGRSVSSTRTDLAILMAR